MRRQDLQIYFLLGLYIIHSVNGESQYETIEPRNFDFITFAQNWPQTLCLNQTGVVPLPEHCGEDFDKEWSIHGIWPSDFGEIGPNYCNSSVNFDPNNFVTLKNELDKKWISVKYNTNDAFWRKQWDKHGTCGVFLETIDTQFKYFQQALKLFDTYNIKRILVGANILPGREYPVQDILNAFEKTLKKKVIVTCMIKGEKENSHLFEIHICLDKTFQPIDCDISRNKFHCDITRNVSYPDTSSKSASGGTIWGTTGFAIPFFITLFLIRIQIKFVV